MHASPPPPSGGNDTDRSLDWIEPISLLWSSRKLIAFFTGIVTVGAVAVSFLLPKYYESTATILPQTDTGRLAGLAGLSDLAAMAGIAGGGDVPLTELYPSIIISEAVLRNIIYSKYSSELFKERVNLIEVWEIEDEAPRDYEIALEKLREELAVSFDRKTSVVTVSIMTREPQLSTDIINNITKELDIFIRTKRTTSASEQRKWIEARLVEVKRDLDKCEDGLKEFREKNRRINDSPQLLLEQERLTREVLINSTIYLELKKQMEMVKIEEIKSVPIVTVMDEARPASKKSRPKRTLIVVISFFIAFVGSAAYVLAANRYHDNLSLLVGVFSHSSDSNANESQLTEQKEAES